MKDRIRFINKVRELRKAKGMSQTELAQKAGTTQNTISSIETGQYSPSAYLSGLICRALGCKWEECFDYVLEPDETK